MCGRYTLTRQDKLIEDLDAALGESVQGEWWKPRFNVAPTQPAPVVVASQDGKRLVEMMRWGLLPFWARAAEQRSAGPRPEGPQNSTARVPLAGSGKGGARPPLMINARVESLQDKPAFRDALARKRCLVPADGFFEWITVSPSARGLGKDKQPMYMHPEPRRTICFAGLWARVRNDAGMVTSFTIITGPPNPLVAPIHDRMPVVLDPGAYAAWLEPGLDASGARALLEIPSVGDWVAEAVSTRVNNAKNDDPGCIGPPEKPLDLFSGG